MATLTVVLSYDDLTSDLAQRFVLDGRPPAITMGRAADDGAAGFRAPAELRFPDKFMSGSHTVLEARGDGHVVRDAGSRNGTWVNGRNVSEHRLSDGDVIELGHTLLCYRRVPAEELAALEQTPAPTLGPTRTLSAKVAVLVRDLERIARSRESVLLLAETGAGKEVAATMVHLRSGRAGDFCPVDCGAVPETLFESTFFGHKRGAFTGASEARLGEIQRADGGTLFLDEIANMSASAQAKLLRVIEEGKLTPLGASDPVEVDVRWIAATNKDLLADGSGFRADLLRRVGGFVARVPPLRQRREDLGILTAHLLRDAGVRHAAISVAAARRLFASTLPGNVRQLRTTLRAASVLAGDAPIELAHLGALEALDDPRAAETAAAEDAEPARRARAPEKAELEAALEAAGGNVVHVARALGTHARQVYRWIEKHGIDLEKHRGGPP